MKKCSDCNVEMLDNGYLEGQHPFEVGVDGKSHISVHMRQNAHKTGTRSFCIGYRVAGPDPGGFRLVVFR